MNYQWVLRLMLTVKTNDKKTTAIEKQNCLTKILVNY